MYTGRHKSRNILLTDTCWFRPLPELQICSLIILLRTSLSRYHRRFWLDDPNFVRGSCTCLCRISILAASEPNAGLIRNGGNWDEMSLLGWSVLLVTSLYLSSFFWHMYTYCGSYESTTFKVRQTLLLNILLSVDLMYQFLESLIWSWNWEISCLRKAFSD